MTRPDTYDDTSDDAERFEIEQLAREQDADRISTADINGRAHDLVSDLLEAGVVTPIPEDRVLVHEPSHTAFDSTVQLAAFHPGWTAARDAEE